jgi:diaminohydroxyphosphoribosylaminopyrimidine deaminase / 5-amino-6-(5-phosphoribosylamino)uracil reductase
MSQHACSPCGRVLVATASRDDSQMQALHAAGAEILICQDSAGRVDLPAVIAELGARHINEVHVEAGAILSGAFIQQALVDEILVYMAPVLIGAGRDAVGWTPLEALAQAASFRFTEAVKIGPDLRLQARPLRT